MATTVANHGDLLASESLVNDVMMLLAERDVSILQHPALMYVGDAAGSGSATLALPGIGIGADQAAAFAVGTDATVTDFTDLKVSVTPARQVLYREVGDGIWNVGGAGINQERLVEDAVTGHLTRLVQLLATAGASFTASKGGTTTLTMATLRSAKHALEQAQVRGPYVAILSPKAFGEFQDDLADNAGGALQYTAPTQDMALAQGYGFAGNWANIDIYISDFVTDDTVDYQNILFGKYGLVYGDMSVSVATDGNALNLGKILLEKDRNPKAGVTEWISQSWLAAGIGIQAAGTRVLSAV